MNFGIGGHRNLKRMKRGKARNQLCSAGIALRMRPKAPSIDRRRITAQRNDVPHASLPVLVGNLGYFTLARGNAGQVRGRNEACFQNDSRHGGMGALAC